MANGRQSPFVSWVLKHLRRINSLDIVGSGVGLEPLPDEEQIILRLIARLGDRRVLYHNGCGVARKDMIESASRIRENITEALGDLPANSAARGPIERMRSAVHDFQSFLEERFMPDGHGGPEEAFYIAIGELRQAVRSSAAELLWIYKIDQETAASRLTRGA